MPSLSHTRKFIILKKEFSNMKSNNAKGHCKLEIKGIRGIVNINIENVEKDNFFNVLLLSNNTHYPVLDLGKVYTDNSGKGKEEFIFFERDLEAKGFFLDELSGVVVGKGSQVLLAGYLGKEDGSIEEYINTLSEENITEEFLDLPMETVIEENGFDSLNDSREIETVDLEGFPEESNLDNIPKVEDPILEMGLNNYESELENINEEHIENDNIVAVFNSAGFIENEEVINSEKESFTDSTNVIIDDVEEELNLSDRVIDVQNIKKSNIKTQTVDYVLSILRFFPYVEPFKNENKGYNWWIIETDKENNYRAYLPYLSHIIGGNSKEYYPKEYVSSNQLINKYKHYLFGLYNENDSVKYFVYGVPGKFRLSDHPYGGVTGFNTWYEGKFADGYWVLYIDPETGNVIYPQIPMNPIK